MFPGRGPKRPRISQSKKTSAPQHHRRSMVLDAIKNYMRALPEGVPELQSADGIHNIMEYDLRMPLKITKPFPSREGHELSLDRRS
jgi:hypothetical protein